MTWDSTDPFPFLVRDDFCDAVALDHLLAVWPATGWGEFDNERERKRTFNSKHDATLMEVLRPFNEPEMLTKLSELTGIDDLMGDPDFLGSGLHESLPGGLLGIHTDFNFHTGLGLDRRLNGLLYLNHDWDEDWGGHLELWSESECVIEIAPVFNRFVLFATSDRSFHGHPHPLACPKGMTRKSIAVYWYTKGRPVDEQSTPHSTVFMEMV